MKKFILRTFVFLCVAALAFLTLVGCVSDSDKDKTETPVEDNRLLRAQGDDFVNEKGEKVFIKAVNAGGLFIQEEWMCATDLVDHLTLCETLESRFGKEKALELIGIYESAFWTENDFDNVECDERDIYVILDLHGAYGSQNGSDHSGDTSGANLFGSEENESRTVELWKTVAARYRDRDIIAGYDLLNEPTGANDLQRWAFYDRLYDAVRSVDDRHIIIIESVWETKNLPDPAFFEWENVAYSYHNYCWEGVGNAEKLNEFTDTKVADYVALTYEVPVFVGEFTCFEEEAAWEHTLSEYTENNVNYAVWTYKVYGTDTSWGIYSGAPTEKVDPFTDSYEEIARQTTENYTPYPMYERLFKAA